MSSPSSSAPRYQPVEFLPEGGSFDLLSVEEVATTNFASMPDLPVGVHLKEAWSFIQDTKDEKPVKGRFPTRNWSMVDKMATWFPVALGMAEVPVPVLLSHSSSLYGLSGEFNSRMFPNTAFEWDVAFCPHGSTKAIPRSLLSAEQLFLASLWLHLLIRTNRVYPGDTPDHPKLRLVNTRAVKVLDYQTVHYAFREIYRKKLAAHLLATTNPLVDWSKEPFVPWKGMRFFHGTEFRLLQADPSRVDVIRRDQLYGNIAGSVDYQTYHVSSNAWSAYVDAMNLASRMVKSSILPDCALKPDTSFTTPYVEKAINYSKNSSVFTYRLKKDGKELRMLDLRSDYHVPSKRTQNDRFSAISDITGIKYGNDHTKNRTPLAKMLYELFKDTDVDGAILNNDIEWVWFKPKENLSWEWSPRFDNFTNRLANIGFEGSPSRPSAIDTKLREFKDTMEMHGMGVALEALGNGFEREFIARWSHPRQQLTEADKWSPAVFAPKIRAFLVGESVVNKQITKLDYFQWTIPSNKPGVEYANQYIGEVQDVSSIWAREQIDATVLRVVEVDYTEFWKAVCPDALDMYMGNSVTEDYYKGETELATAYKILLQVIRESQPDNGKQIQLLFKLPNGRSQLVPPIDGQTKKLIAEAIAARLAKAKRGRDDDSGETDERPSNMQRLVAPNRQAGTNGRVVVII